MESLSSIIKHFISCTKRSVGVYKFLSNTPHPTPAIIIYSAVTPKMTIWALVLYLYLHGVCEGFHARTFELEDKQR